MLRQTSSSMSQETSYVAAAQHRLSTHSLILTVLAIRPPHAPSQQPARARHTGHGHQIIPTYAKSLINLNTEWLFRLLSPESRKMAGIQSISNATEPRPGWSPRSQSHGLRGQCESVCTFSDLSPLIRDLIACKWNPVALSGPNG